MDQKLEVNVDLFQALTLVLGASPTEATPVVVLSAYLHSRRPHPKVGSRFNIGTALNVAYSAAIRSYLLDNTESVDPRKFLRVGRDAIAVKVAHYLRVVAGLND